LWNREIELGFDSEHQVDHVHRGQTDIHEQRGRLKIGSNRILFEDGFDESKQSALDIASGLHFDFSPVVSIPSLLAKNPSHDARDYNSTTALKTVNPV
jgi:hypothetical protein